MEILKKLFRTREKIDWDKVRESLKPKIEELKRPAVRLKKTSKIKKSKFGGKPFVDRNDFEWPRNKGKPMTFLAQIDLSEISNVYRYEWLSNKGSIEVGLFFIIPSQMVTSNIHLTWIMCVKLKRYS